MCFLEFLSISLFVEKLNGLSRGNASRFSLWRLRIHGASQCETSLLSDSKKEPFEVLTHRDLNCFGKLRQHRWPKRLPVLEELPKGRRKTSLNLCVFLFAIFQHEAVTWTHPIQYRPKKGGRHTGKRIYFISTHFHRKWRRKGFDGG